MTGTRRETVTIRATDGQDINNFVDILYRDNRDLVERLDDFTIIEGLGTFGGSGEKPARSVEFKITFRQDPGDPPERGRGAVIAFTAIQGIVEAFDLLLEITFREVR